MADYSADLKNTMYYCNDNSINTTVTGLEPSYKYVNADIIHARLGHSGQHNNCETCIVSKGRKANTGTISTRKPATHVFERLHMDLIGPVSTNINGHIEQCPTLSDKRYALVIVDEKSRYTHTYLLENKSDAKHEIISLINLIKINLIMISKPYTLIVEVNF